MRLTLLLRSTSKFVSLVASKEIRPAYRRAFSLQLLTPVFASLRQPLLGAHRPLAVLGSGVPAASMFCEHLADADDAALKRLVTVYILQKHPFKGVSLGSATFAARKRGLFLAEGGILPFMAKKKPYFLAGAINLTTLITTLITTHRSHHSVYINALCHGQAGSGSYSVQCMGEINTNKGSHWEPLFVYHLP